MSKSIFLLFVYMTLAGCSIGSLAKNKTPYIYKKPYHHEDSALIFPVMFFVQAFGEFEGHVLLDNFSFKES